MDYFNILILSLLYGVSVHICGLLAYQYLCNGVNRETWTIIEEYFKTRESILTEHRKKWVVDKYTTLTERDTYFTGYVVALFIFIGSGISSVTTMPVLMIPYFLGLYLSGRYILDTRKLLIHTNSLVISDDCADDMLNSMKGVDNDNVVAHRVYYGMIIHGMQDITEPLDKVCLKMLKYSGVTTLISFALLVIVH